ncbi:Mesaconyl-C(4)-CoA hydratase [Pseudomonas fluorescens]|uniref:Mesaconyl-C(4)-CoA hydratase n=2 Tax=Pseudomonas fluorescens TaxID=294 RepID=A0A5E7NA11_PSEFL|nr:Mesaconyl-C(4)-CoA hydratase [Pseudomonas fluorescens]
MWAGGRVEFFKPLRVDAQASRVSTVLNVEEKAGRTGSLLFVTLGHDYLQDGDLTIREEQDIVYREPTPPRLSSSQALPVADWEEGVEPTPTLLLRYSAVTFNGHRIHYDWPYATKTEGYPGLVVHGPLIATLNLRAFSRANPQSRLRRFAYRGIRPLIAPEPFSVGGRIVAPGQAELWAGNDAGMAQQAELTFD